MKTNTAIFVTEVTVNDPDTNAPVLLEIYKHEQSGGMFGMDASFIDQNFDEDEKPTVADPFNNNSIVELHSF
jgi:hypothetical protein